MKKNNVWELLKILGDGAMQVFKLISELHTPLSTGHHKKIILKSTKQGLYYTLIMGWSLAPSTTLLSMYTGTKSSWKISHYKKNSNGFN